MSSPAAKKQKQQLDPAAFFKILKDAGIEMFCGVPDSLLKDFCAYVTDNTPASSHIIAANEGAAVGLAVGHYMATRAPALVYMQNSGTGNAVNPLLSIADADCYGTPMLIVIGWRGEPGVKDEPQHKKQGRVQTQLLDAMELPHAVLAADAATAQAQVARALADMKQRSTSYVLLVRKDLFAPYKLQSERKTAFPLRREAAIEAVLRGVDAARDVFVSTTGKPSRELFELRERRGEGHGADFLTIGGMGHASQIALGVALARPTRQVFVLDGDGAVLMHMGSLAIAAQSGAKNFKHIVINNGAHDSVGGQPTVALDVDLSAVAKACGYKHVLPVAESADAIEAAARALRAAEGPAFLEVRVNKGARNELGRPTTTPVQNRDSFMAYLEEK